MTEPGPPPFRLTRHFSLASLAGVMLVMAALMLFYREHTTSRLAEQVGHANADVTRLLANLLWPGHGAFVTGPPGRDAAALRADPRQAQLQRKMREAMRGLNIVKLKIYDRAGLTVFSTDLNQLGENHRANPLLIQALGGQVANVFTHRDRFHALEGELVNRDLIASYVPFSSRPGQPVEAVFEVYADVTEQRQEEAEAWNLVVATLLSTLGALYLFLLATVRRADRVMGAQERARAEQAAQVQHMADHDGLTGLPNRRSFEGRLAQALAQAQRRGQLAALMFIDLDGFKAVNDGQGHAAGDLLLQALTQRLRSSLRNGEQLFRVGGDEFTVLLPQVDGAADAAALAQRLVAVVASPVDLPGGAVQVGASIGIALSPTDAADGDALLRLADDAMYLAKARGKGSHAFHGEAAVPAAAADLPAPQRQRQSA